jgi:hypothetical protein
MRFANRPTLLRGAKRPSGERAGSAPQWPSKCRGYLFRFRFARFSSSECARQGNGGQGIDPGIWGIANLRVYAQICVTRVLRIPLPLPATVSRQPYRRMRAGCHDQTPNRAVNRTCRTRSFFLASGSGGTPVTFNC